MLVRMIFSSVAAPSSTSSVEEILKAGRLHNTQNGITGVLCYGYGVYLALMEGERSRINQTYARILQDPRHNSPELLQFDEIVSRSFANWALGRVNLETLNTPAILKYAPQWPLQPNLWSGKAAIAFLEDLAASARVQAR